jgi:hypothetical protein
MNVEVEIYMSNMIKFFKENPNDLINLIPKIKEEEFYFKLRETAIKNYEKGEEVNLTKNQLITICADIHGKVKKNKKVFLSDKSIEDILNDSEYQNLTIEKLMIKTPFGSYSLN